MKIREISSYKYELMSDEIVILYGNLYQDFKHEYFELSGKVLTIRKGYQWYGTSGPTINTKSTRLAGLVHDVLYQAIRMGFLPKSYKNLADKNLKYFMRNYRPFKENIKNLKNCLKEMIKPESDYSRWEITKQSIYLTKEIFLRSWTEFRACYFYLGVKWFGASSIKTKKEANETIIEI